MEEDVLGTRQTVVGTHYDPCTRCGRLVPRGQTAAPRVAGEGPTLLGDAPGAARPLEATRDGPPPLLCSSCAEDVARGEPLQRPARATGVGGTDLGEPSQ